MDNLQVVIENVHVRLEYASPGRDPVSIGLTLSNLSILTTDANGKVVFVERSSDAVKKMLHKVVHFSHLARSRHGATSERAFARERVAGRPRVISCQAGQAIQARIHTCPMLSDGTTGKKRQYFHVERGTAVHCIGYNARY